MHEVVETLLQELRGIGCSIQLHGETLRVSGQLTDGLRAAIQQHKKEIMAELHRRVAEADLADNLLAAQGWCAVKSKALNNEIVVWVRDAGVAVPPEWQWHVRYTLAELELLVKVEPRLTREGLRKTHEVKRVFEGTVVPCASSS